MLKKINQYKYILLPFLMPIFPILFLYQNNIFEVEGRQIIAPIIITTLINIFLFFILRIKYKRNKTAIILIGFWFIIYFYSNFYIGVQNIFGPNFFMIRYIILIWIILITLFVYCLLQKEIFVNKIIFVSSIFLLIITFISLFKILTGNYSKYSINYKKTKNKIYLFNKKKEYRDIYFIILDGYPSNKTLINNFSFNNSFFIKNLERHKFHVFQNTRSNYTVTFLSIASLLNMEYINYLTNKENISGIDIRPANYLISNSKVVSFLKEKKYKIINLSSGWGATDILENADLNIKYNKYIDDFSFILIKPPNKYFNLPNMVLSEPNKVSIVDFLMLAIKSCLPFTGILSKASFVFL